MHFSPKIFSALLRAQDVLSEQKSQVFTEDISYVNGISVHNWPALQFSVSAKLDNWKFNVDLEDDAENRGIISFTLKNLFSRLVISYFCVFLFFCVQDTEFPSQLQVCSGGLHEVLVPHKDVDNRLLLF